LRGHGPSLQLQHHHGQNHLAGSLGAFSRRRYGDGRCRWNIIAHSRRRAADAGEGLLLATLSPRETLDPWYTTIRDDSLASFFEG